MKTMEYVLKFKNPIKIREDITTDRIVMQFSSSFRLEIGDKILIDSFNIVDYDPNLSEEEANEIDIHFGDKECIIYDICYYGNTENGVYGIATISPINMPEDEVKKLPDDLIFKGAGPAERYLRSMKIYRINRDRIVKAIKNGELKAIKYPPDHRWYIEKKDIDNWAKTLYL